MEDRGAAATGAAVEQVISAGVGRAAPHAEALGFTSETRRALEGECLQPG